MTTEASAAQPQSVLRATAELVGRHFRVRVRGLGGALLGELHCNEVELDALTRLMPVEKRP